MNKQIIFKLLPVFFFSIMFFSCVDDKYPYLEEDPPGFGRSLYSVLKQDKRFTTYLEMLGRTDSAYITVLDRTGSRTLFVPTDEAFEQFFLNNEYGVSGIDDMSDAMIKTFLSFYTLENAYVTTSLGSSKGESGPADGNCLRRYTTLLTTDTIPLTKKYPKNPQFARFAGNSIYLTTPGDWTLLNFTQSYFDKKQMKNDDFNTLYSGGDRQNKDIHIFDAKIIEGDIVARNGYIHVLDKVILPPKNMYEEIRDISTETIFRELLERFSEPVYNATATKVLWDRHPEIKDSVFQIEFFDQAGRVIVDEAGNEYNVEPLLFSPSENGSRGSGLEGKVPSDMPVIFVPTDQAMKDYLSNSYLSEYKNWDEVPDDIAAKFVRSHMKYSFMNSYPNRLKEAVDEQKGDLMFPSFNYNKDVKSAKICRNGLVYIMNRVVAPRDFSTVVAPILNNPQTRIANWLINESYNNTALKFNYYLTSLENTFTVFIPIDEAFKDYPDPLYQTDNTTIKRLMKFRYDEALKGVNFIYCNMNGDSIAAPSKPNYNDANNKTLQTMQNRLQDVMDYHIVVGDIDNEQVYAQTKGGAYIKITRNGNQMRLQGAGDIEKGTYANVIEAFVDNNYIKNGKVYFIDKRLEHTLASPYTYATQHREAVEFFELLNHYNDPDNTFFPEGIALDPSNPTKITMRPFEKNVSTKPVQQEYVPPVFSLTDGIDYIVPFMGLYDYTILVPTNDAVDKAVRNNVIKTVDEIKAIDNFYTQVEEIKKVILFLKNHFVDKSVFTKQYYPQANSSDYTLPQEFTTAAKNPVTKDFYRVTIDKQGETLIIKNKNGIEKARTIQDVDMAMSRSYRFLNNNIVTNSRAVIYQINDVLTVND